MLNILPEQPTEENPHIIPDYPYGRLRCQMRVWVESRKGYGVRYVTQTENPKNGKWNKPHYGIYQAVILVGIDPENGHTTYASIGHGAWEERISEFENTYGAYLSEEQKKVIAGIKAIQKIMHERWIAAHPEDK